MASTSSGSCGDIREVYLRLYSRSSDTMVWYRTAFNFSHMEDSKKQKMTMELHKFIEGEPKSSPVVPNNFSTCAGISPYIYLFGSPRATNSVYRINTQKNDRKWEDCPSLNIERCKPFPLVFGTSLILVGSLSPYYIGTPNFPLALGDILEDASLEKLQQWKTIPFPPDVYVIKSSLCALHTAENRLLYVPYKCCTPLFAYDLREKRWSSSGKVNRVVSPNPKAFVLEESFVWWDKGCICISDFNLKTVSKKSCFHLGLIGREYAPLTEINIRSKVQFLHLADHIFLLIWKKDLKLHFLELALHPFTNSHGRIKLNVSIRSKNFVEGSELPDFDKLDLIDAIVM